MGHTGCGAIKGACDGVELGHLTQLLEKIRPAVDAVTSVRGEQSSANRVFADAVSLKNVTISVESITDRSSVIADLVASGQVRILGAMYDITTGKVTFLD